MYTAIVEMKEGTCVLQAPTIDAMYMLIFNLDENIFVNGTQVKAQGGKLPGCDGYFCGYTRGGLRALYERA